MIQIKNLSKSYNKNEKIIKNLNLKIEDGEIFGFLGPNGAGKTTTIKMITGILDIDEGDIEIDGYSISKNPIEAKKCFGYVPDSPDMFLKLKGIEYLDFMADIYDVGLKERQEKIEKLTKIFEISEVLNDKIQSYSHGMRQKIIIVGSLLHNPKNWIIDEPMIGLDPKSTYELKKIMREITSQNNCVFFSTHILDVAEKLCDRVAIIKNGKIVKVGKMKDIKGDESLETVFLELEDK